MHASGVVIAGRPALGVRHGTITGGLPVGEVLRRGTTSTTLARGTRCYSKIEGGGSGEGVFTGRRQSHQHSADDGLWWLGTLL
jgi:hypothetical protein